MIDATTKVPLKVGTSYQGKSYAETPQHQRRAYIDLPVSRLGEIEDVLNQHGIGYWVDGSYMLPSNGGPEEAIIFLVRGTDPDAVQAILDAAR